MLGVSRAVITGLIDAGFVSPARGPRNEYRFSFQDVVLLRTAHHLQTARIPPRRIVRALQRLQAGLPDHLPLTGLRITAVGSDVAVRDGGAAREVESGQLLMDFELAPAPGSIAIFERAGGTVAAAAGPATPAAADVGAGTADDPAAAAFADGQRVEPSDPAAAEAAYRRTLGLAPEHAGAWLNLGALLCEAGRCGEAVALFDRAIVHCPHDALLHFNRAIALEDGHRMADALAAYGRCLALAPDMADAHYNAARLHDGLGQAQAALRHYSAYRRLQQQGAS